MARKKPATRASAKGIQAMREQGQTRSDWASAERMSRAEIGRLADKEDGPPPEGWESMVELRVRPGMAAPSPNGWTVPPSRRKEGGCGD